MSLIGLRNLSRLCRRVSSQCCLEEPLHLSRSDVTRFIVSTHRCLSQNVSGNTARHTSVASQVILSARQTSSVTVTSLPVYLRCGFHTTAPRNIAPIFLIVIKPLAKAISIITGRRLRIWWRSQSDESRSEYRQRLVKLWPVFAAVGAALGVAAGVHYYTHIDEAPVTHRRRYLAFTHHQFLEIAEFEYKAQLEKAGDSIVQPTHPIYRRIVNIVQNIVNSNVDLDFMRQQTWTVIVVDSPEMNAFVLPTGHIFVYTGLLKVAETDSQLAVVLGHEMSHALLSHAAEQVSFATVLDMLLIVVMATIWAVMPTDGVAVITQWFYNKAMQIMLHLPYNRKLEEEADQVGLQLIAKACYDVRESSAFWDKMSLHEQMAANNNNKTDINNNNTKSTTTPTTTPTSVVLPEWLSTHPNNENRARRLDSLVPAAMELRTQCKCAPLPSHDPRVTVDKLRQLLDDNKQQQSQSTKPATPPVVVGATVTAASSAP